jgi:hypothetical protein
MPQQLRPTRAALRAAARLAPLSLTVVLAAATMTSSAFAQPAGPPKKTVTPAEIPDARYVDVVSERGQNASGLYITGPFAQLKGPEGVARTIKKAGLNAAVIDLKDGAGRVTFDSKIPILQDQKKPFIPDLPAFLRALKDKGIYTIARITCFADPKLPLAHPERAIIHTQRKTPWVSWGTAGTWLDPYNEANHDMIVELTKEAAAAGFDEIQLDYIRFPVDDGIKYAEFPSQKADSPERWQLLLGLLRRIDEAVQIPLGVDVFGLTAFDFGDDTVLGQRLHEWTSHVEVFSPMLYLYAMRNWARGHENRAYALLYTGVSQMRRRIGDRPVIRPFVQAFEKSSDPVDSTFVEGEVLGAKQGGADGLLFWHPGANYGMLLRNMTGAARGAFPFTTPGRVQHRKTVWDRTRAGGAKSSVAETPQRRENAATKP